MDRQQRMRHLYCLEWWSPTWSLLWLLVVVQVVVIVVAVSTVHMVVNVEVVVVASESEGLVVDGDDGVDEPTGSCRLVLDRDRPNFGWQIYMAGFVYWP
jgi:hypothetical protein